MAEVDSVVEFKDQLAGLIADQAKYYAKATEDMKNFGAANTTTIETLKAIQSQVDAIEKKIADKINTDVPAKSFHDVLAENEQVKRLLVDKKGLAIINIEWHQMAELLDQKTTITSTAIGQATPGIIAGDRRAGLVSEARMTLRVRDVLAARPTTSPLLYFVRVATPIGPASPQVETVAKQENSVTFDVDTEQVRTLATWIPAAKQIMDDFPELEGFLRSALPYAVNKLEDQQLLTGSGTGENLNGLVTQATAFNTALLVNSAGWTRFDVLGRAIQQINASNEIDPTFVVLHPNDWWSIRLTKDNQGRYIFGDPQQPLTNPNIFGLSVVSTTGMTAGTFLVGSGNPAASEIRDRMAMQVEISTEHADFWTRNMVAIRAEKRLALVVYRPATYIKGTFTTSPTT